MAQTHDMDEDDDGQSRPSIKSLLIGGILAIVIGGGSGFGLGYFTGASTPLTSVAAKQEGAVADPNLPGEKKTAQDDGAKGTQGDAEKPEDHGAGASKTHVTPIDPIVTNLSEPSDLWIRLELVITSDVPLEGDLANQIHQDLFAHVRAMRLSEMAGPSAFIDLKAELLARASQRSQGQVRNVYVKTLLYE